MEEPKLTPAQKQYQRKEKIKNYKQYKKSEVVNMLHGVVDLPRERIVEVYDAICDLFTELAFKEGVVFLPRFGKFIFEPKARKRMWNPKEEKTLIYQNPRVTFKIAHKLKTILRKEHRRNCYQLAELNNIDPKDFKPAERRTKLKKKDLENE